MIVKPEKKDKVLKDNHKIYKQKRFNSFMKEKSVKKREVNWILVLIMSAIFGAYGVDRFIMGHIGLGVLKLLTAGGLGVWWLVDLILIATKHPFKGVEWTHTS